MIDLIAFIESARSQLVQDLEQDVKTSLKRLSYLLDVHSFCQDEIELNQSTLLWPQGISPVFEGSEQVSIL